MLSRFLPQHAAQAVCDLEAKAAGRYRGALGANARQVAGLIREAVHIVLPPNGEIYRENTMGGAMPSDDECASLIGIPAPITCFEYAWTNFNGGCPPAYEWSDLARKRVTLVVDSKQLDSVAASVGHAQTLTFVSVFYSERFSSWSLHPYAIRAKAPMVFSQRPQSRGAWDWGWLGAVLSMTTSSFVPLDDGDVQKCIGEMRPDITAVVQCCHALRAGAAFEEQTEPSASRRWKFEKKGVGGFTYHVLKLPAGSSGRSYERVGVHDSPRFHIRRAHIRKLPTGSLTFVRQCCVGDPQKGVVSKHYAVEREAARGG